MRGVGFQEHGGLESVRWVDIPEPTPGPGEVRIRLRAAGFNRVDLFTLRGIPGVTIERPHVLGSDGAGTVDALGPGIEDLPTGTEVLLNPGIWDGRCDACLAGDEALCRDYRILGEHTQGTATTHVVVPRRNVYPRPEGLGPEEAAAAPLVFLTAWRAIRTVGALRPGETCGIVGAGGGVATAAIQVAHHLGARVVAVTRSAEKAERARALGADEALVFSDEAPLDKLLWQWSQKRGIDVILDSVGRPTVPRSLRALARGGRLVVVGATAGPLAEIDLRTLFWRQASVRGSTMAGRREFEEMLEAVRAGHLKPTIDTILPWDRGPEALVRLASEEKFGKVVLTVG
ncbi:MAG TPA: zinc-binding dehydrogenase [Thermoplasmata archaeon]|nr:zinc-binding dehydrogenase [Thermoplasmata archaeon]